MKFAADNKGKHKNGDDYATYWTWFALQLVAASILLGTAIQAHSVTGEFSYPFAIFCAVPGMALLLFAIDRWVKRDEK